MLEESQFYNTCLGIHLWNTHLECEFGKKFKKRKKEKSEILKIGCILAAQEILV